MHSRNEIVPVLVLLQATKSHFRAWDVFLGVLKVFKLVETKPSAISFKRVLIVPGCLLPK